jgi:hypothetical protein
MFESTSNSQNLAPNNLPSGQPMSKVDMPMPPKSPLAVNNNPAPRSMVQPVPSRPKPSPVNPVSGPSLTMQPPAANLKSNEPEDILSSVDRGEAVIRKPAQPVAPIPGPMPTPAARPLPPAEPQDLGHTFKKVAIIIVLVLLGGAVLGAGGYYGYKLMNSEQSVINQPVTDLNINQPEINQPVDLNINSNQPNINQPAEVPPAEAPMDTDRDGLSDEDEMLYGTNPNEIDSDKDDLTDRDEIKVFKTDPNNADTDGDGYNDGAEIRAGYDPKGPGKLFNIQ